MRNMKTKFIAFAALLAIILLTPLAEAKNIVKIGSDVTIEAGQQAGSVIVVGGQVTVDGLVEKSVTTVGGSVILTSNAVVRGNVIVVGGIVAQGNGSQVFGDVTEINSSNLSNAIASVLRGEMEGWSLVLNIISVCFFVILLTLALLLTLLLPRPLIAVTGSIQANKAKSLFWGVLASLMIVPFFMLLAISIIGITLIPLAFTVILLAFILGYIAAAELTGNYILVKIIHSRKESLVGGTLLGLIALWIIGWIPYLGWIIKVIVLTFGLGGVLLAFFNRKRKLTEPPAQSATTTEAPTEPPAA
jgi:hypothetical protein